MNWNEFGLTLDFGEQTFQVTRATVIELLTIGSVIFFLIFLYLNFIVPRKGKRCRWRRDSKGERPPFIKWVCKDCLVEAFTTDNRPPKECKKNLKSVA